MQTFSPYQSTRTSLLAALALSVLAACGGGGGTGGTGTTTPPPGGGPVSTVSTGVMTKGSAIVNGVKFEDTIANISIDDRPKTNAALLTGMVVKVVGRVNDDGITGTADRVNALIEVRGRPTTVSTVNNTQSLLLLNQTVLVDDQTIPSNWANFNDIVPGPAGTLIEVHGLRDANGNIRATRIEANAAQMEDRTVDEIRGVVANGAGTRPSTFTIGGQTINVGATAVIEPANANWPNGTVVEVYCSAQPCGVNGAAFQASRLKVEDDSAFRPSSGQRMDAEGLISGFNPSSPNSFSVGSTLVTTNGSTRFEGGIASDLANNVKVEAEGLWDGTRLAASKIEFKRSVVRLQGFVSAANAGLNQFTMDVAGHSVTIVRDSLTDGALPPVNLTNCVQVRGQRRLPATAAIVTAGEIRPGNCSNSDRPVIQAPVEAETSTTITLLGFEINISNPIDRPNQWVDVNDVRIPTLAAFLNAITPPTPNAAGSVPGTLVKVIFDDATPAVRQVEIED